MRHLKVLGILLAGGWVGLCFSSAQPAASATAKAPRPNILFIIADDLGYGDLGCYGQKKIQTPNLDRLAAEGTVFTQYYAGSTVCAPSRCALLTGKHTGHARIRGNSAQQHPLLPEDVTVAEVLKPAGYKTCALGKWGLGKLNSTGHPRQQGFDEFFGYLTHREAHNYYPEQLWRNEQPWPFPDNAHNARGTYVHDWFTRSAQNFSRINRPDHQFPDRRFFIYLAYTIPHANNALGQATGNGMEVPSDAPYSAETWPAPERNKAAMITRLDRDIGALLDHLKKHKADDSTIIFFTSDNGPHKEGGVDPKFFASSGPLRGLKRDLYEGGIRVPMIVRWPGKVPAGVTNHFPWAAWDVLPTLAELSGGQPPADLDGRSIVPVLLGGEQQHASAFYWECHEGGFKQAARMGDWKGVKLAADQPLELYDLKIDPGETKNLADQFPEIALKLADFLKAARTESEHWPPRTGSGQ